MIQTLRREEKYSQKRRGLSGTSQMVQAKRFCLDAWLVALGSQSVYGRIYSLIPTSDGHVIGFGWGVLWAEAHYL